MADNTGEERLNSPTNNESENSSDEIIPNKDTETISPNQETKNMEVHKHPHHVSHKKKWGEYLLEFFMLFLAVFLGFIAENYREHIVEHQQEKQYMITLIEDLNIDTTDMGRLKRTLYSVMQREDSIKKYLHPPISAEKLPEYYRESWIVPRMRSYTYNDRTVEQLRSAGNYRLIRNKSVTDSIISYDIRMRGTFSKTYNVLFESQLKLIDLQNDILDVGIADKYFDDNDNLEIDSLKKDNLWPLHLLTTDTKLLFHHYNACLSHIGWVINLYHWIELMTSKAINLITMIKKEYHLK
jgi:hypothetical protein